MVLEEHRQKLDGEGATLLGKVVGAANRMDQLVEDVLALSRLSRAPVQEPPIDVEKLVQQIIQDRADLQPPKAVVTVEGPLPSGDAAD